MTGLPLVLYTLAAAAYVGHFATRHPRVGHAATALLGAAALSHTFIIGMQTMALGHVPFAGTTGAVSVFVWLLALAYLYTELSTGERAMGVFVVPLIAALQVLPTAMYRVGELPAVLHSAWFSLHVTTLLFAYASFALACVIGITYVLLFRELKDKRLGFFSARLPSLDSLDRMNVRAVTVGWIFLTIGVLAGAFWAVRLLPGAADPRLQAMSLADPKIFVALLCWLVYSFELYARRGMGWRGRRAAMLSAIGFAIVLLNFVPVGYFLTRSHNFS
jgi:ABC-type transport system involved in cytochrome c biogenesis permease subunit